MQFVICTHCAVHFTNSQRFRVRVRLSARFRVRVRLRARFRIRVRLRARFRIRVRLGLVGLISIAQFMNAQCNL